MSTSAREYTIAAYFWPAYHDEPRWRPFFKGTEGEWEIIRNAKPKFPGHYQPRVPLWGYEDESDPRVMEKKIDAAASHGVNAFIFDWYWYENQPFLEKTINEGFLKARNNDKIQFYLMWANHNATTLWDLERSHKDEIIWPGAVDRKTFDAIVDRVIDRYLRHPSYYKIEGKPVFAIFEVNSMIAGLGGVEEAREALDSFRWKVAAAGFPGLHLQMILRDKILPDSAPLAQTIQRLGIDSLTAYQLCVQSWPPEGEYGAWANKAMSDLETFTGQFPVPYFPHVSIGWDSNPRFKGRHTDVIDQSSTAFEDCLRRAKAFVDQRGLKPKLITINSWNEWSEGSYLEPDMLYGMAFLEAVRRVVMPPQNRRVGVA